MSDRRTVNVHRISSGLLYLFLSAVFLLSLSCGSDATDPESQPTGQTGIERTIGPEGGSLEITDPNNTAYGAKISTPPNALSEDTVLSIQAADRVTATPADTYAAGPAISFLPDGTIFNTAATISLPYNDADDDGYIDGTTISEEQVHAMVFNKQSGHWQDITITGINTDTNIIQLQTNHFTDYEAILYLTKTCKTVDTPIDAGPFYFTVYFDFRSEPNIYKASVSDVGADLNVGNATFLDTQSAIIEEENFPDMFDRIVDATKWTWSGEIVTELTFLEDKIGLADEEVEVTISIEAPKTIQFDWNFNYTDMAPYEMMVLKFSGSTDTVCTLLDRSPVTPSNLTVVETADTAVRLSWDEVTYIYGTVWYNLYISEDNGSTFRLASRHYTAEGIATGLTPLTSYLFQVTAVYDDEIESDFSNVVTGTTLAANIPPSTPTNLTYTSVTSSSVFLSWDSASDDDGAIAGYRVYISPDDDNYTTASTVTSTSASITGLDSQAVYFFKVSAIDNQDEESQWSDAVSVTTL